jgi:hypothetical protein
MSSAGGSTTHGQASDSSEKALARNDGYIAGLMIDAALHHHRLKVIARYRTVLTMSTWRRSEEGRHCHQHAGSERRVGGRASPGAAAPSRVD